MRTIHPVHPEDFIHYNTRQIREKFVLDKLVEPNTIHAVYTHYDRMIIGAACPATTPLKLETYDELKSDHFLDRREMGIINIGGPGKITIDGEMVELDKLDCCYIGKGKKAIVFSGNNASNVAKFIFFSCPAHHEYPLQVMKAADASPAEWGSAETANHRTINKYIHGEGLQSCQLVMGVTHFKPGSIWNTMPPHLHERRMESYFYFDLPDTQRIIHFMGEPQETRHIFLDNEEAIVSPPWSIHCGTATASYSFIWAMAGENMSFADMDPVSLKSLQ